MPVPPRKAAAAARAGMMAALGAAGGRAAAALLRRRGPGEPPAGLGAGPRRYRYKEKWVSVSRSRSLHPITPPLHHSGPSRSPNCVPAPCPRFHSAIPGPEPPPPPPPRDHQPLGCRGHRRFLRLQKGPGEFGSTERGAGFLLEKR